MPPTPVVIGAIIVLMAISMIAATSIGAVRVSRAFALVAVVAVVAIPLGVLSTTYGWGEKEHGGGDGAHAAGDAARGESLFRQGACPACHTIQGVSSGTIGPDLTRIGTGAATRKAGTTAEVYIRESIAQPSAFLAPGFQNQMPQGLAAGSQLDDLVAFLLTRQ